MPRFTVRLDIRTARPLTGDQLDAVQGGRWAVHADGKPRGRRLEVRMVMTGGDIAGALIRAQNVILDQIPGDIRFAELGADDVPRRRA